MNHKEQKQYPTTYLWVLIFLSKLYDFKRNTSKALEFVNKAIEHTPTLVESYMLKARIYKVRIILLNTKIK